MVEAAMLFEFAGAAGVDYADVRNRDDIRGTRIDGGIVVVKGKRRTIEDLAETDRNGVRLENLNGGFGFRRAHQPDQRDVIFRRADASGVAGRFGFGDESGIVKQSGRRAPGHWGSLVKDGV